MKLLNRVYSRLSDNAVRASPLYWLGGGKRTVGTQQRPDASNRSEDSDGSELVRRIYRLARTGQTSVELWRDCTTRTIENMDKLDLKGLCSILHSYGYMKYRDRNMLELMSGKLIESVRIVNSAQIASILRAYSILNFRSDFLFRLIIPEISLRLDMMNVSQVSSIFYSYCNLGYYNKNLFQSIQSYLYRNVDQLRPYELTLLLNGYCRNFKGLDEKFLTVLSFQFCKLVSTYDDKLFSLSVNSLSRLNFCNHKYLPSLIESEVYNRLKLAKDALPSKSMSLILNALSKHCKSCTPLFTFLSQNVLKRIKEFDVHSICLVLSALSRVSLSDRKTYDKIAEYIGRNSLKLYPRAIASVLYSYARAGHLHGPLFYFSSKHLEINIAKYTCDEVAMILRSFRLLNVKNEDVMTAVADYILKNTPDYVPIKFEDQCSHERVGNPLQPDNVAVNKGSDSSTAYGVVNGASERVIDQKEKGEDYDGFNINLLEVVTPETHVSSNYLSNGKIHSLLWIVEVYTRFFFVNDQINRCLTRIANELVVRMSELTPFIISRLIYSLSQLNFRHTPCLEMLLNEVGNPRRGFKFDQKELSLIHYATKSYGLDPQGCGVYKYNRLDFQKVVETYIGKDGGTLKIIRRIVTNDIPSSKPLYLELLTNPLTEELYGTRPPVVEKQNKLSSSHVYSPYFSDEVDQGENEDDCGYDNTDNANDQDVIYIHIPRYVKELLNVDESEYNVNARLTEALDNHINYNFNLD